MHEVQSVCLQKVQDDKTCDRSVSAAYPPVVCIVGCDGDVADGRIEPHIEDLVLIARPRDLCAPLQVPGDAPQLQTIPHPCIGGLYVTQ